MVVCKDSLDRLRADRARGKDASSIVENDVSAILNGKSYEQLSQLQRQIQAKLTSGEPVDVDYWEGLLKNLLVWKAKVRLSSVITDNIMTLARFAGKAAHFTRNSRPQSFGTTAKETA